MLRLARFGRQLSAVTVPRGAERARFDVSTGAVVPGTDFKVVEKKRNEDFDFDMVMLRHERTGARWVHIESDDLNNTFAVGFKTVPRDDTGVAHILEHTVLCGSQRFPVRDPFFAMLNGRSMSTFMNAFTASDWTLYPFSTCNPADFDNLSQVYLDAAFFPLLTEDDFSQEGHRLEFEDASDATSPLVRRGVVYNEMKGAMSDPDAVLHREMGRAVFPDLTYACNSGGEPSAIPKLTHEALREFHAVHYHPSNSYFFTYGDLPLEGHLRAVEERVLSRFPEGIDPGTAVPPQARFDAPRRVSAACPPDPAGPAGSGNRALVSWCMGFRSDDVFRVGAMQVLTTLLCASPSGPMYRAIVESGLAPRFSAGNGFSASTPEPTFTIGAQGFADGPDAAERVERAVLDTLEACARDGFPREEIDAVLHQVELSVRGGSTNMGLHVALQVFSQWIHGASVFEDLDVSAFLARLRSELDSGPLFQNLIREELLGNTHRVTVSLTPDADHLEAQERAEREELDALSASGALDADALVSVAARLAERQCEEPDTSCLPAVSVDDIERTVPPTVYDVQPLEGASAGSAAILQWSSQPTNGIVWARLALDASAVPSEHWEHLSLYTSIATKLGARGQDPAELALRVRSRTGGVAVSSMARSEYTDPAAIRERIVFSGSAFERDADELASVLSDVIEAPEFDHPARFSALVRSYVSAAGTDLIGSGHRYAASHARAALSDVAWRSDVAGGIRAIAHAKRAYAPPDAESGAGDADADAEAHFDRVLSSMHDVARTVAALPVTGLAINARASARASAEPPLSSLAARLSESRHSESRHPESRPRAPLPARERLSYITVPASVHYVACAIPTGVADSDHANTAALSLLSRVITHGRLHREVRERGGAYGAFCSHADAALTFGSYRDPNDAATLDAFRDAALWAASHLRSGSADARAAVDRARIIALSAIDAPVHPSDRGLSHFYSGVSEDDRRGRREAFLAATAEDLAAAAERFVGPAAFADVGGGGGAAVTILGPQRGGGRPFEWGGARFRTLSMDDVRHEHELAGE